jgi:hypothetical protein
MIQLQATPQPARASGTLHRLLKNLLRFMTTLVALVLIIPRLPEVVTVLAH